MTPVRFAGRILGWWVADGAGVVAYVSASRTGMGWAR